MNADRVMTGSTKQPRSARATAGAGSGYALLLTLLFLAAFGLRTVNLYLADLTFDEVATVFVARRPLWEVIRYVMGAAREHPPFYYLLMSLWMRWVGVSEFAVRFPSVLASLLTVSWGMKLGRRLFGKRQALWVAALFALAPFSVWAGRNGRMYALVMLLAIVIMERWLHWAARPDWRHGLVFTALSMVGAMTHYYLVLLWPVQGILLLLMPRETRAIRKPWLVIITALGVGVSGFIVISPGVLAMVLEVARRFPVRHFRANELRILVTELYIWGFRPEFIRAGFLGLGLTLIGWTLTWTRKPAASKLLIVWGLAPLILLHFVPEKLEARYLTPIFPALMLGIAALLIRLPHALLRGLAGAALLWFCAWRAPAIMEYSDVSFSTRVQILHTAVQPGDGLLMNGPWPSLLLTYYPPPQGLPVHAVPAAAPPGFSEAVDVPRLTAILDVHERLWVSYGAVQWADPRYSVSRWLAENAYCVFDREGLALYVRPADVVIRTPGTIPLSDGVRLVHGALDRHAVQTGDVVRVLLQFGGENLDRSIIVNLALLDSGGAVWQQEEFRLGPVHQPLDSPLPDPWREQRGFLIHPGIPPGDYTVSLRVYRDGVLIEESHDFHGWVAVSPLGIAAGTSGPDLVRLLPHHELEVPVGAASDLSITAFEPHSHHFMQGYPAGFNLWWRVGRSPQAELVDVRLRGPETFEVGGFRLGPSFYPGPAWQAGDIIRQSISFKLPDTLPAGAYTVQVKPAPEGQAPVRESVPQSEAGWSSVASIHVEARSRQYSAPLLRTRRAGRFGDTLLLQGFQLGRARPHAGDQVPLTVYWKALERPNRLYAVFNHLRAPDGTVVWQGDSWPQDGLYTTDHWLRGEVVAETYMIPLPDDLPPGVYTLYTGVYDPATGERLEATTTRGDQLTNNELALFEWVIKR
jgi:hypothetical protein